MVRNKPFEFEKSLPLSKYRKIPECPSTAKLLDLDLGVLLLPVDLISARVPRASTGPGVGV